VLITSFFIFDFYKNMKVGYLNRLERWRLGRVGMGGFGLEEAVELGERDISGNGEWS
jgi:hypothetical protein